MRLLLIPVSIAALGVLGGCGLPCFAGGTVACTCLDGRGGTQQCGADGKLAACMCPVADAGTSSFALGKDCTQTTCPDGYACLQNGKNAPAFCSNACTTAADTCGEGYVGPGRPACVFAADGSPTANHCGVICESATICPSCDGTCPSPLTCQPSAAPGVKVCQ